MRIESARVIRLIPGGLVLGCALASVPALHAQGGAESVPNFPLEAYVKASNSNAGDAFGRALATTGHTMAIGAFHEDSSSTGINGDEHTEGALDSGAVYVFTKQSGTWSQQAYLKSSNSNFRDEFGSSLALSGDTLVVGAPLEDSKATGVNGNELDGNAVHAGAAYVFVRDGDTWTQQAYLKASNTEAEDKFGGSVAVFGDTIVVGARNESSAASGVDGDQSDNEAPSAGAAYVFVRNGTTWTQQAYLKASNSGAGDGFGASLALWGDTLVVGAQGEDSSLVGGPTDNTASSTGAAYVFVRDGATWTEQALLKASNAETHDSFGVAVGLWEDRLVVGAQGEDSSATGVHGNQLGNGANGSGAAYVFLRDGSTWTQDVYLKASTIESMANFGSTVAVYGDFVAVGAPFYEFANLQAGAAYLFRRQGTHWLTHKSITTTNLGEGDRYGGAVALSDFTLLVGARYEDSPANGINGNPDVNGAIDAGAAYLYVNLDREPWDDEGSALAGVAGAPQLVGLGSLISGSDNSITLSHAAPSSPGALFLALSSTPVPFKGGVLKPFPFLPPHFALTSPSGTYVLAWAMPSPVPRATEIWAQWAIQDAAALNGVSLSNAIKDLTP